MLTDLGVQGLLGLEHCGRLLGSFHRRGELCLALTQGAGRGGGRSGTGSSISSSHTSDECKRGLDGVRSVISSL